MAGKKQAINVKIIKDTGIIFDGEVLCAFIPGKFGNSAILPHHVPMVQLLYKGEVVVQSDSGKKKIADIEAGLARVDSNELFVMIEK